MVLAAAREAAAVGEYCDDDAGGEDRAIPVEAAARAWPAHRDRRVPPAHRRTEG